MKALRVAAVIASTVLLAAALFAQQPQEQPGQLPDQGAPADQGPAPPPLSPQQLDDLVAPIALYPDNLLSQILAASTYPIEVVEAQQWLKQNHHLKGQQLLDAAKQQNWDPSVQALVIFPDVLTRLNQDIRWTTDLGNAFLAQQADVMHAVQDMRAKAEANGKLRSTPQETVTTENQNGQSAIVIQPPDPEQVYVPNYNPAYVWGPPIYGYYPPLLYPGIDVGFGFWPGIDLGFYFGGGWGLYGGFGWGWGPNWFGGGLFVNGNFFHRYGFNDYHRGLGNGAWVHDPAHRGGVAYPNRAVANRFGGAGAAARGSSAFRGGAEGARGAEGRGEAAGRSFSARPEAPASHSAFGRIQNGGATRMQSDHGFSSIGRSGGFGGGGFRGGGFGGGGGFHGGGGGGGRR
jgi:hypothetical protein